MVNYKIKESTLYIDKPIRSKDLYDIYARLKSINKVHISHASSNDPCTIAIARSLSLKDVSIIYEHKNVLCEEKYELSQAHTVDSSQESLNIINRFSMFSLGLNNSRAANIIWSSTLRKYVIFILIDNIMLITSFFICVGIFVMVTMYTDMSKYGLAKQAGISFNTGAVKFFAPIMTNIILAGKAGTSTTSQIQTMYTQEELKIIKLMSVDIDKSFLHAIFASFVISSLFLTLIAIVSMFIGGCISWVMFRESAQYFYIYCIKTTEIMRIFEILLKATFSGIAMGFIVCTYGLYGKEKEGNILHATSKAFEYSLIAGILTQIICKVTLGI